LGFRHSQKNAATPYRVPIKETSYAKKIGDLLERKSPNGWLLFFFEQIYIAVTFARRKPLHGCILVAEDATLMDFAL
jgi:hypothetical protein